MPHLTTRDTMSYDDLQQHAILCVCQRCHQASYMTHPQAICIKCRRVAEGIPVSP